MEQTSIHLPRLSNFPLYSIYNSFLNHSCSPYCCHSSCGSLEPVWICHDRLSALLSCCFLLTSPTHYSSSKLLSCECLNLNSRCSWHISSLKIFSLRPSLIFYSLFAIYLMLMVLSSLGMKHKRLSSFFDISSVTWTHIVSFNQALSWRWIVGKVNFLCM